MRWLCFLLVGLTCLAGSFSAWAGNGAEVVKVLPHLLDAEGRHALQPSLFERDAYQAHLRTHPELVQSLAYDVLCKAGTHRKGALRLRLELRTALGDNARPTVLETEVKPGWRGRKWVRLTLDAKKRDELGEVSAWRAVLLDGDQEIAEQKSFLW